MGYADRTKTIVRVWILPAWARVRVTVADAGGLERIRNCDARGPAGRDRRQDLHRQREHDDRKKFL